MSLFTPIERYRTGIIFIILCITGFFALQIPGLKFELDYLSLLPAEAEKSPNTERAIQQQDNQITSPDSFPYSYFLVIESSNLFAAEILETIRAVMTSLESRSDFGARISPFRYTGISSAYGFPVFQPADPRVDDSPWTQEDADEFKRRLLDDDIVLGYLIQPQAMLIYYQVSETALNPERLAEFSAIIAPLQKQAEVYISGSAVLSSRMREYLQRDMRNLLALSMILMLLVYFTFFRSFQAMLLPFLLSGTSLIWTLGIMALLGKPLTVISIIVPPIVLTLSSSYSIHLLHAYLRVADSPSRISTAAAGVSRTIIPASMTSAGGFLSLLSSQIPAFRDFGLLSAIGVLSCAILSLSFLPALIAIFPLKPPADGHMNERPGQLWRFSGIVAKLWPLPILLLLITLVFFFPAYQSVEIESDFMSYFPEDEKIYQDSLQIARIFGGLDPFKVSIKSPDGSSEYFTSPDVLQAISQYEAAIALESPDIAKILSYPAYIRYVHRLLFSVPGIPDSQAQLLLLQRNLDHLRSGPLASQLRQLVNEDGSELHILIRYFDSEQTGFQTASSARRVLSVLRSNVHLLPLDAEIFIGGSGARTAELNMKISSDQQRFTWLSLGVVCIFSLLFFRSPSFALLSLVPVSVGVAGNYIFMQAAGIPFHLITLGFSAVTIGVGVDDALHFLVRYRLLKKNGEEASESAIIQRCIRESGIAIIQTTAAITTGLLALTFASYIPIRYFGFLLSFSMIVTMAATLILLPAILMCAGYLRTRSR